MARVLLYTIHDREAAGIRVLAACLREGGHQAEVHLLGADSTLERVPKAPESLMARPGGASAARLYFEGSFLKIPVEKYEVPFPACFGAHIRKWRPDIIGYSGRSILAANCVPWFAAMRAAAPGALLVAGGFGPSTDPEFYLRAGADCVVRGEGEETLRELANAVNAGLPWNGFDGVSWRDGSQCRHNPLRPLIRNLDSLPMQLLHTPGIFYEECGNLVESDPVGMDRKARPLTGRGCPGTCSYCASGNWRSMYTAQGIPAPKYRWRSTARVIEEVLVHKEHGVDTIYFRDDFFIRPVAEMLDFLARYKREVALPFKAVFPSAFIARHPEVLDAAIDAGLLNMRLGVQSGDECFASEIFNRKNDNARLFAVARQCASRFLPIAVDFIDGYSLPGRDDHEAKLEFIKGLPPFNPALPQGVLFNISYLRVEVNVPLVRICPEITKSFLPVKDFIYRGMLMHFRYVMSDIEFGALRSNAYYKENPSLLMPLYRFFVRSRHNEYVLQRARELAGRNVFFWGCGDVYARRKHLFLGTRPQKILVDVAVPEKRLDGLDVADAFAVLREEALPVIIFSAQAMRIAQKIRLHFPDYPAGNIIPCETAS